MKYLKNHVYIPFIIIAIAVLGAFIAFSPKIFHVEAAPVLVTGWVWSDMPTTSNQDMNPGNAQGGNGFGWITLGNPGANVSFDQSTGLFSGYGASEWTDWLHFNPSGPTPDGTSPGAYISTDCLEGSSPICVVEGWIKFVSGGTPQSGGWDGWVKMSTGSTHQVVLDKASGLITGYAWGGDVAGWLHFDASINPVVADTCPNIPGDQDIPWMNQNSYVFDTQWIPAVCVHDPCYLDTNADGYWDTFDGNNSACIQGGQVDISATACNAAGGSVITWNSWDPHTSISCTASGGFGFSGTVGPSGTINVSNLPNGQTTFTLGPCTDSLGNIVANYPSGTTTASAIVQCGTPTEVCNGIDDDQDGQTDEGGVCPNIVVTLDAVPSSFPDCKNQVSNLTWTVLSPNSPITSCTGSGGFGFPASPNTSGGTIPINTTPMVNGSSYQFLVQCTNAAGQTSQDPAVIACGTSIPGEICGNGVDDDGDNIGTNGVVYSTYVDEGCPGNGGGISPIYHEI